MLTRRLILAAGLALAGAAALADEVVKSGAFNGENGHLTRGTVQIVAVAGGHVLRFAEDFSHDGTAPDATIGFGKDGYTEAFNLGPLLQIKGAQEFALPAGFDPAQVNEVYIWCRQFSVSLGSAKLG